MSDCDNCPNDETCCRQAESDTVLKKPMKNKQALKDNSDEGLVEGIAIKLSAIDNGFVHNFDANLFAKEIIVKVRQHDKQSHCACKFEHGKEIIEGRCKYHGGIINLLAVAKCPQCDGSGAYYDNMGEVCECQWCYEMAQVVLPSPPGKD